MNWKPVFYVGIILCSLSNFNVPVEASVLRNQQELINQLVNYESPKEIIPGDQYTKAIKDIVNEYDVNGEFKKDLKYFCKENGEKYFHGNMNNIEYFMYKIDNLIYLDFTNNVSNSKVRKILLRHLFLDMKQLKKLI